MVPHGCLAHTGGETIGAQPLADGAVNLRFAFQTHPDARLPSLSPGFPQAGAFHLLLLLVTR